MHFSLNHTRGEELFVHVFFAIKREERRERRQNEGDKKFLYFCRFDLCIDQSGLTKILKGERTSNKQLEMF